MLKKYLNTRLIINKLFYLTNSDFTPLSNVISNSLGMVLSIVSDVHHLMSRGIEPRFPYIKDQYFGDILKLIDSNSAKMLNASFEAVFDNSYKMLNEVESDLVYEPLKQSEEIKEAMRTRKTSLIDMLD